MIGQARQVLDQNRNIAEDLKSLEGKIKPEELESLMNALREQKLLMKSTLDTLLEEEKPKS